MNDVYKFYGKDKGIINAECSNFYSKAKSYIDLLTENDIMNVGDVGSRVLFEKLLEEALKTRQESEFQVYQAKVNEDKFNERRANIG